MAAGFEDQEGLPGKHFSKQLAATVRDIQWSYAIFWSLSTSRQGVLAWRDGYYNGDIKTRKTTQPMEFRADQMGVHRSKQLRELFNSLSAGDSNQQTRRPSASLSPEDLTDSEWYYLVCMSFTFDPGQGLPGKVLTSNKHIWLSNAPFADSKIFSRSVLAKSASIQTVVCFPFMGGVLELGTTELVMEDPALILHVTTSFSELPNPVCSEQSISSYPMAEVDEGNLCPNLDDVVDTMALGDHKLMAKCQHPLASGTPVFPFPFPSYTSNKEDDLTQDKVEEFRANICEELKVGSDDSSNECSPNQHTDDSLRMDGLTGTSQVQSRRLMDDELSNGLHGSLNSSDCVSQSFVNPQRVLSSPKGERVKNYPIYYFQEGNFTKLISLDLDGDKTHYTRTISAILTNSKQLTSISCFRNGSHEFSFKIWKRGLNAPKLLTGTSQKLLKKILINTVWMHGGQSLKHREDNGLRNEPCKPEGDDVGVSHVLSERRRREKLNEKFLVLRSLVPSISKVDKASILGDTIEYLKELERRVDELESCRELVELKGKGRRKHLDVAERTSDNYGSNGIANGEKPSASKRKASNIEKAEAGDHWVLTKDCAIDVNVMANDKEVKVKMRCPWRDCLLLEIVEAISNLHLDAHSLQSSTVDGVLALTLRVKFRGSVVLPPGMIKRALERVVSKC